MNRVLPLALTTFLFAATGAFSQDGIHTPRVGLVRDGGGSLRPVWGVRGNFLAGDVWYDGALSAGYSGRFVMVKSADEIRVMNAEGALVDSQPAGGEDALFAFSASGEPLLAAVPETGEAWRWSGSRLVAASWLLGSLDGTLVAAAPSKARSVALVVDRGDALWLVRRSLRDGRTMLENVLPGVKAPVYLDADGTLVYTGRDQLVVRHPDSSETRLPAPSAAARFERIGEHWIRYGSYALRLDGAVELFVLPGGAR